MTRKEYTLSFDKAEESEQSVRKFLLKNSDSVRLTEVHSIELGFFRINRGGEKDKKEEIIILIKHYSLFF